VTLLKPFFLFLLLLFQTTIFRRFTAAEIDFYTNFLEAFVSPAFAIFVLLSSPRVVAMERNLNGGSSSAVFFFCFFFVLFEILVRKSRLKPKEIALILCCTLISQWSLLSLSVSFTLGGLAWYYGIGKSSAVELSGMLTGLLPDKPLKQYV